MNRYTSRRILLRQRKRRRSPHSSRTTMPFLPKSPRLISKTKWAIGWQSFVTITPLLFFYYCCAIFIIVYSYYHLDESRKRFIYGGIVICYANKVLIEWITRSNWLRGNEWSIWKFSARTVRDNFKYHQFICYEYKYKIFYHVWSLKWLDKYRKGIEEHLHRTEGLKKSHPLLMALWY